MAFLQIIEMRTKKFDELQGMDREWEASTEGKRTARRVIVARDHNDPERVVVMAFFDSYESAQENSQLPETSAMAEKQAALLEGPPSFIDLDIIEDREV
jgi:quinol monooxygenase YgiN